MNIQGVEVKMYFFRIVSILLCFLCFILLSCNQKGVTEPNIEKIKWIVINSGISDLRSTDRPEGYFGDIEDAFLLSFGKGFDFDLSLGGGLMPRGLTLF